MPAPILFPATFIFVLLSLFCVPWHVSLNGDGSSVLRTLRSGMTLIEVRPPFPGRKVWQGDRHWPPCPFRAANNIPRIDALRLNGRNQCSDHDRKYVQYEGIDQPTLFSIPWPPNLALEEELRGHIGRARVSHVGGWHSPIPAPALWGGQALCRAKGHLQREDHTRGMVDQVTRVSAAASNSTYVIEYRSVTVITSSPIPICGSCAVPQYSPLNLGIMLWTYDNVRDQDATGVSEDTNGDSCKEVPCVAWDSNRSDWCLMNSSVLASPPIMHRINIVTLLDLRSRDISCPLTEHQR